MVGRVFSLFLCVFFVAVAIGSARAEDVLVIGDSHTVGPFGSALVKKLRSQNGMRAAVGASCGSKPKHFLETSFSNSICSWNIGYSDPPKGSGLESSKKNGRAPMPKLAGMMSDRKPGIVVIAHGTNELPTRPGFEYGKLPGRPPSASAVKSALADAKSDAITTIKAVKAGGAKCIWVGPPKMQEEIYSIDIQDQFTAMYESVCAANGCTFLNSRKVTKADDTKKDTAMGIHYYGTAGTAWGTDMGDLVVKEIRPTAKTTTLNQNTPADSFQAK